MTLANAVLWVGISVGSMCNAEAAETKTESRTESKTLDNIVKLTRMQYNR